MLLFQTLTAANFIHHATEELTACAAPRWVYVHSANARFQVTPVGLRVQSLVATSVPVFGADGRAQSSDTAAPAGPVRRDYLLRFSPDGPDPLLTRQVKLLQRYHYDLRELLTGLDRDYAFEVAFRQVRHPALPAVLRLVVQSLPDVPASSTHSDYEAARHLCWAEVGTVAVESIFSPFTAAPALQAPVVPHRGGTRPYNRATVLRELATGRLAPLPHPLNDTRHVLDGVQPAQLAYPLERLELLPVLVEDTSWEVVRLPGGVLQLTSGQLGTLPLFLQVVRPVRLRTAAAKASSTVMRIAA